MNRNPRPKPHLVFLWVFPIADTQQFYLDPTAFLTVKEIFIYDVKNKGLKLPSLRSARKIFENGGSSILFAAECKVL